MTWSCCISLPFFYINLYIFAKAWFPINVSVFATHRSCLLMRTLFCSAGFHRQPSLGLLQGCLYLEVCKSRSASGIEMAITIFWKSLLYFLFWSLLFFLEDRKYFRDLRCWFLQVTVTAYRGTGFAKVQHVRLCCEHPGFCCESSDCLWAVVFIHHCAVRVKTSLYTNF